MYISKRFVVTLFCALLCAPVSLARQSQDQQRDTQVKNTLSQDVLIIIQQEKARFIAQRAVAEMRLKVFDQTGAVVYDSGAIAETELNWPLQDANGQAVRSGLYAYQLSIKDVGAETARVRRGHFIVDRAKDRDGLTDKLWVTSQNDNGVGAELTLARDENVTVAGAAINNERGVARRSEQPDRDGDGRKVEAESQTQTAAMKEGAAMTAAGTVGRIAKFTSATDVGDSLITELNGNIGIGTTTPVGNLHVHGTTGITTTGPGAAFFFSDRETTTNTKYYAWYAQDNAARFWRSDVGNLMSITPNGNVGIGTNDPLGNLHVHGTTGITTTGPGAAFFFRNRETTTNTDYWAWYSQGNVAYFWRTGVGNLMSVTPSGNLGIGTMNPATKLHVEGTGFVEATIKSRNERAILALTNTLGPGAYTWTVESGVNGQPGLFGIYNRVVGRSGLEINGDLTVSVKALQITGGADLAENFDVRAAAATAIQPGMVVTIDPAEPGKLALCRRAYDRRVAGVISGAGDVKPGMMMGATGTLADGQHPVALSGRVYVWVDATRGAIRPGDLLTTSSTPGHAMRAGNVAKAQGAILGKAMTGLKRGKGLALALVTLQ